MSVGSEVQLRSSLRVELLAVWKQWSTQQRRLLRLIGEIERSGEWAVDGASSCARWLADTLRIEPSTAREWLRVSRALGRLPACDAALADGRLSYSQVRAVTRLATAENEVELCELAERVPANRLACALASWLVRHETPEETEQRQHATRGMGWRTDVDGMVVGWFRLSPENAARLTTELDRRIRETRRDASADAWPTVAQQRSDALVSLTEAGGADIAYEVVVHVRADGCTLDDGTAVNENAVARMLPDSFVRLLIHDAERRPINASGKHRFPTARQRRVVRERDRGCVDCGATEFLEYDHDPDYEVSGRTIVSELVLRCWKCHRRRHEERMAARAQGARRRPG
jgi:hypothetical protein